MKMKNKLLKSLALSVSMLFVAVGVAFAATRITVDPVKLTVLEGDEFEISLVMDSRGDEVFGTSTTVLYPWLDVDLVEVNGGDYFANFEYAHDGEIGRLELHGYFDNSDDSKVGTGRLAQLKFKSKRSDGSGRVSIICRDNEFTQVINSNGENVQDCAQMGYIDLYYTYDTTATPTPVPTPTPRPTPTPTAASPETEVINYTDKGGGESEQMATDSSETTDEAEGMTSPSPSASPQLATTPPREPLSLGGYQLDQILMLVAIGAGGLGVLFIIMYLISRIGKGKKDRPPEPPAQPPQPQGPQQQSPEQGSQSPQYQPTQQTIDQTPPVDQQPAYQKQPAASQQVGVPQQTPIEPQVETQPVEAPPMPSDSLQS